MNRKSTGDEARPVATRRPVQIAAFGAASATVCALLGGGAGRLTRAQTVPTTPLARKSTLLSSAAQQTNAVPGLGDRPTPKNFGTYTNPVNDRDLPDPCVLRANNVYWMSHTTGGPNVGWPLYKSTDLVHWTFVKHLLHATDGPEGAANKPAWMTDAFWATEIHQIRSSKRFVLTFTSWSKQYGRLCVGIATAPRVDGPYTVQDAPLVTDTVSTLDTHLFQDGNGKIYLYWKRDSDAGSGVGGTIRVREMNSEATGWATGSVATVALTGDERATDPAAVWEKGLVEAPWVIKQGVYYYLFYSGAFTDTTYALGVARSVSPTGPFTRCPGNPILRSNSVWGGPGHGAFIRDGRGDYFHLYHARRQANPKAGRVQLLDRLYWNGDWPAFGDGGTPSTEARAAPAL